MTFSRHYLAHRATLNAVDLAEVQGCRRGRNQLGFAYHIVFVRLLNRFPKQEPFEVLDKLLLFTGCNSGSTRLSLRSTNGQRQTISEHQQRIARYRDLCHFGATESSSLCCATSARSSETTSSCTVSMPSIADSSGGRAHGLSVQNRTDLPDTLTCRGSRLQGNTLTFGRTEYLQSDGL